MQQQQQQQSVEATLTEPRSALQSTLGLASSAASLVLYPYVTAGKVAYQATSYAVNAPIKITKHVKDSILGSSTQEREDGVEEEFGNGAACDLFGERSVSRGSGLHHPAGGSDVVDLFGETLPILDAEPFATPEEAKGGVVSQLLFLPVRVVSSGVSTAVSIPGSLISYSGKKISGAVSTSQSLATTALVVSGGAVARTSLHVAQGITYGAFSTASFTATKLSGAVGTSVRSVGYVIPESVSNAVWQGMGATGNASASVVSYAIAVPAYRMLGALVPDLSMYFSERDCVEKTREVVMMLVRVMGPQNAFYLLKFVYETVNSDEAYDMFLLCQDIVRESFDGGNYRIAGSSIGESTGVSALVPVVKEMFNMLPSIDELFDAVALVADVSEEMLNHVAPLSSPFSSSSNRLASGDLQSSRFEYVDESSDNDEGDDSESGHSTISADAFEPFSDDQEGEDYVASLEEPVVVFAAGFEPSLESTSKPPSPDVREERATGFTFGVASLLSQVGDSDEATSLLNTFGDLLDVLVE